MISPPTVVQVCAKVTAASIVLLAVCITLAAGCMTMRPASEISETGEIRVEVAVGDTVRVLTKYGERPTFAVTEINADALVGAGRRIPYADMVFVEKLAVSGINTAGAVTLSILGTAVTVLLLDDDRIMEGIRESLERQ